MNQYCVNCLHGESFGLYTVSLQKRLIKHGKGPANVSLHWACTKIEARNEPGHEKACLLHILATAQLISALVFVTFKK